MRLYNGDVDLDFDPVAHSYTINGTPVPSVTKITGIIDKPALIYWAVNETVKSLQKTWMPDTAYTKNQINSIIDDAKNARFRRSGKALNIGSLAHDWIERFVKAEMYGLPRPSMPDYKPVLSAAQEFVDLVESRDITFNSSERKVCSVKYMYSGTADLDLTTGDAKRYVADLKTSKAIYPEYFLQCAAYAAALTEESGTHYDGLMIIRLPKEGDDSLEFQVEDDIVGLFDVFRSCLNVWRWKNE